MQLDSETEHIEFKEAKDNFHFETLAEYCCALANQGGGSMILGVTDGKPRQIVGTRAFDQPDRTKIGLFERLHWRIDVVEIVTREGRVLSFVVPPILCCTRTTSGTATKLQRAVPYARREQPSADVDRANGTHS